ncbi:hypothetical protein [Sorangium sp. So ce1099]
MTGGRAQFRNCRSTSCQDTLYLRKGEQHFKGCYVEGSVEECAI